MRYDYDIILGGGSGDIVCGVVSRRTRRRIRYSPASYRAGELIQERIPVVREGRSIRTVADSIHVYPTLAMASQHAAQRWYEQKAAQPLAETALGACAHVLRPRQRLIGLGLVGAML